MNDLKCVIYVALYFLLNVFSCNKHLKMKHKLGDRFLILLLNLSTLPQYFCKGNFHAALCGDAAFVRSQKASLQNSEE